MSITTDRLASRILRELVHIVNNVIKNPNVGYITITETRVTKDLSFAKVYYTIMTEDEAIKTRAAELLETNKKEIRMKLAEKIRDVRKIPDLVFEFDKALAYGNHIAKLLNEIKKEEE